MLNRNTTKRYLAPVIAALLVAGWATAETRDVDSAKLGMFDRFGATFTDTPGTPATPTIYTPVFVGAGTVTGAAGDITPAMYTGAAIGDLAIAVVESDGTNVPTMAGWTAVTCSGIQDTGTELNVFYQILAGVDPTRLIAVNTGDHLTGFIFGFKVGSFNASTPLETACNATALGSTTTPASVAITTANNTSMVVTVFSTDRDVNSGPFVSALATTGSTSNPFEGTASAVTSAAGGIKNLGNGGGVEVILGLQATAGSTGIVSGTATVGVMTVITIAVNGAAS